MTDSNFKIDGTFLGDLAAIETRVAEVPEADRELFQLALGYLYLADGPKSIPRDGKAAAEKHLTETENFVFQWLYKRTDGKLRRIYGANVLDAVKKSRYQCAQCAFADVRALHIEQIETEDDSTRQFTCLCANCNTIAAREKEMGVVATNRKRAAETAAKKAALEAEE